MIRNYQEFIEDQKTIVYQIKADYWFPKNEEGKIIGDKKELRKWVDEMISNKKTTCANCCIVINSHEYYLHQLCFKKKCPKSKYEFEFTCYECKWGWKFKYTLKNYE